MNELLKAMQEFETRNSIEIFLYLESNGIGAIQDTATGHYIFDFKNIEDLIKKLNRKT